MDLENILELVGADKLAPEIKGQTTELLELLIADPNHIPALERLLTLIGSDRLDAPTQETIRENLMSLIDAAARKLLNEIGPVKAVELKQVRRTKFEKKVISRLYCNVDQNKEPLIVNSDHDIEKLAKSNASKIGKISKTNFKWDSGYGSEPFKSSTEKVIKASDYRWESDGLSPLSGKTYRTNTKRGR